MKVKRTNNRRHRLSNSQRIRLFLKHHATFLHTSMRMLLGVGVVLCMVFAVYQSLIYSKSFSISNIVIHGTSLMSKEHVLKQAQLKIGDSILAFDVNRVALDLEKMPWVRTARVRRVLPQTVEIWIEEHRPVFIVALDTLYLANDLGDMFKPYEKNEKINLPVLSGLERDDLIRDATLAKQTILQANSLSIFLQDHLESFGILQEIHVDDLLGWSMITSVRDMSHSDKSYYVTFHLGHSPLQRMSVAEQALVTLNKSGMMPKVIWVDSDKNSEHIPVKLYLKPGQINSNVIEKAQHNKKTKETTAFMHGDLG